MLPDDKKVLTFHRPVSDSSDRFGGLKTNCACGSDLPLSEFLNEIRNIDHSRVFVFLELFAFFNLFFRHITWPSPKKNFLTSPHDFSTRLTSLGQKWKKSKFLIPFLIFFYLMEILKILRFCSLAPNYHISNYTLSI